MIIDPMLKILFPVSNYEIALIPSNLSSRSDGQTLTTSLQSLDVCFALDQLKLLVSSYLRVIQLNSIYKEICQTWNKSLTRLTEFTYGSVK